MPHLRERHCLKNAQKKLRFSPVITIQGPRQCGKSVFVREILAKSCLGLEYVTFDQKSLRDIAARSPDTFLEQRLETATLAIDEAQKVPDIFDAIKYQVDLDRRPGRYILLGSTEFSREFLIRESMTGRISRTRMFPLNIAEAQELPANPTVDLMGLNCKSRVSRASFLKHLEHGGFPTIFAVRSKSERDSLKQDWISTTLHRDLHQFPKIKADSELALDILKSIATIEEPETSRIAKLLRYAPRRVNQHINLLEQLFVIHHITPVPYSTGKNRYYLCDSGIADLLGASTERQILTQVISERLSQSFYSQGVAPNLSFYRSQKGALTHLVEETEHDIVALLVFEPGAPDMEKLKRLQAFKEKCLAFQKESNKKKNIHLCAIAEVNTPFSADEINVFPWESIA